MIYFVIYVFLEVIISVNISSFLGGFLTFVEIVLSAAYGVSILINFRKNLFENMNAVSYSCIDFEEFQRLNLFTIVGGIMLIVPGFLTDLIGVLLQFSVITTMAVNHFKARTNRCKTEFKKNIKKDIDVIDVEIINDNTSNK